MSNNNPKRDINYACTAAYRLKMDFFGLMDNIREPISTQWYFKDMEMVHSIMVYV